MHPIIKLAKNIALSNVRELSAPYKMTYALTYRCQCRCSMCGIWRKGPFRELTLDQITEFFRNTEGLSWVNLTGGEIFLRQDLLDVLAAMAKHCRDLYLLNFPTNGYETDVIVTTVKRMLASMPFPKVLITVSLDGPSDLHDAIRNVPASWDRAVETYRRLRLLRNNRFAVYFGMTLQRANAHAFEETVRAVRERINDIRYQDFHVNIAHTSQHYYGNAGCGVGEDKPQLLRQLEQIEALRRGNRFHPVNFLEQRYQRMASSYLTSNKTPVACQALAASFFMDPAGTVYPCTIFDEPIGNIQEFGYCFHDLWNAGKRRGVRREIRNRNCPHCWTPCEAYQSILANLLPSFARS